MKRLLSLLVLSFSIFCHSIAATSNPEYKYQLSICVLFQNEAPYLKEWIEYHKLLGVSHFYCYNHYSTDHYRDVLRPYIQEKTVELKDVFAPADNLIAYYTMQCKCYNDCLNDAKGNSKWVAFLDADEFLLPMQTQMPGRTEPKDTRLFENVLAKTTDEVPTDELSGKEIGEGKEGKKLASNELGRQQADQVQAMKADRDDAPSGKAEKLSAALKKDKSKKTESDEAEKEGRTKLAAANASIQGAGLGSDKAALKDTAEVSRASTIRDIAAQIVEKVQIMKDSDTTRTIVTLRHPPVLAGATVTLIVSDNAKNELNISFANLSPDAKMFLDRKLNEDSLTQTLERKGIIVHMITTKTEAENLNLQGAQPTKEDQQQQQREQSQQQQQREREQQEEENG